MSLNEKQVELRFYLFAIAFLILAVLATGAKEAGLPETQELALFVAISLGIVAILHIPPVYRALDNGLETLFGRFGLGG